MPPVRNTPLLRSAAPLHGLTRALGGPRELLEARRRRCQLRDCCARGEGWYFFSFWCTAAAPHKPACLATAAAAGASAAHPTTIDIVLPLSSVFVDFQSAVFVEWRGRSGSRSITCRCWRCARMNWRSWWCCCSRSVKHGLSSPHFSCWRYMIGSLIPAAAAAAARFPQESGRAPTGGTAGGGAAGAEKKNGRRPGRGC